MSRPVAENAPSAGMIRRQGVTLILSGGMFGVIAMFSENWFTGLICAFAAVLILVDGISRMISTNRMLGAFRKKRIESDKGIDADGSRRQ